VKAVIIFKIKAKCPKCGHIEGKATNHHYHAARVKCGKCDAHIKFLSKKDWNSLMIGGDK
jgi:ribosomal protein S27AE